MRDNFSLMITYKAFWQDNPATFEIRPYFIRVFKQRWYLIAFNPFREKIQTYALDRIRDMSITENKFTLPADVDFESYYDDCFGIITDNNISTEKLLIKVGNYQAAYIKALPLHGSQKWLNPMQITPCLNISSNPPTISGRKYSPTVTMWKSSNRNGSGRR